jgi:hypothetical protein
VNSKIKIEAYVDEQHEFYFNMTEVPEHLLADMQTMSVRQILNHFPGVSIDMILSSLIRNLVSQNKEIYQLRSERVDFLLLEDVKLDPKT